MAAREPAGASVPAGSRRHSWGLAYNAFWRFALLRRRLLPPPVSRLRSAGRHSVRLIAALESRCVSIWVWLFFVERFFAYS